MKKLVLAILLLSFSSLPISAQDDSPPPPLIYLAPRADEIKEFASKENNFSIGFPGVPKVDTKPAKEFTSAIFRVYRHGSSSLVSVWQFKKNVENRQEEILKKYRESILNLAPPFPGAQFPKPSIISETDIQIGKYKGKELAYEADLRFVRVRLLFVGKRVYEIKTDVTNWHILTKYQKDKAADFAKETERFFSSFRLLN